VHESGIDLNKALIECDSCGGFYDSLAGCSACTWRANYAELLDKVQRDNVVREDGCGKGFVLIAWPDGRNAEPEVRFFEAKDKAAIQGQFCYKKGTLFQVLPLRDEFDFSFGAE